MRLEGTLDLEHRRVQRWVPVVAIVIPVFLVMAATTWFIRAFIAPPMAAIPSVTAIAAVEPPAPQTAAPPPQPVRDDNPAALAYAGAGGPPSPAPLPMFATFALAPPRASLLTAPPATIDPALDVDPIEEDIAAVAPAAVAAAPPEAVASLPPDKSTPTPGAAELGSGTPLLGPVPLPPQRPRIAALPTDGQVPLPRTRPPAEAATAADGERRAFSSHGAE